MTSSYVFVNQGNDILLEWVPILAVSGVLVYISAFSIGMGAVPWVIMSEVIQSTCFILVEGAVLK